MLASGGLEKKFRVYHEDFSTVFTVEIFAFLPEIFTLRSICTQTRTVLGYVFKLGAIRSRRGTLSGALSKKIFVKSSQIYL